MIIKIDIPTYWLSKFCLGNQLERHLGADLLLLVLTTVLFHNSVILAALRTLANLSSLFFFWKLRTCSKGQGHIEGAREPARARASCLASFFVLVRWCFSHSSVQILHHASASNL